MALSSRGFQLAWIAPLGISSPTSRPVAEILTEASDRARSDDSDDSDDRSRGAFQKCVRCHLKGVPRGPQVPGFFRFFLSSKVIESHTEAAADPSGPRKQHCQRSTEWHGVARSGTESLRSVSCCQLRSERRRGCLESGRWKCRLTLRVATGRSVSGWDRWE